MKVLIVNQYFYPDVSAVAQLAADLAEDLVGRGHEVTAIASRGAYMATTRLPREGTWNGVQILRVSATNFGRGRILGRIADYLTFYVSALWLCVRLPRHDVLLATSAPPFIASLGILLQRFKGVRFVYWLQDLYPDLAIEFGLLRKHSILAWLLERLARRILKSADQVIVLGQAMKQRIVQKGAAEGDVHVVPNWADGSGIRPVEVARNEFRSLHGLAGRRVVLYSGNMGRAHDLMTLLDAARHFDREPDVSFVFVGHGAKQREVEEAAAALPSIRLLPYQPRERLSESLSAGDVHVVTMAPWALGLLEPSKLYGILAAGRPVLYIGPPDSEVAETILKERVGEVVANGESGEAANALRRLLESSEAVGRRARQVFDARYDRSHRTGQIEQVLIAAAASRCGHK